MYRNHLKTAKYTFSLPRGAWGVSPTASRAEKVFIEGIPLNQRGERNIPKRYLQAAVYSPKEQGYFVYHQGSYIAVEFDFTHCFWYTVKYNNQESCWKTHSIPEQEVGLYIPDSKVTDRSEWGPINNGQDSSDEEEEAKSEAHPESIDIKIPTQEEEKTERQLEKLIAPHHYRYGHANHHRTNTCHKYRRRDILSTKGRRASRRHTVVWRIRISLSNTARM